MTDTSMIELAHVHKRFRGTAEDAVSDLSLSIAEGEIVVLVGPSGCGKTTTLRMINRLIDPTSGSIVVAGKPIDSLPAHALRRTIGYVIQQVGLFPHRSIAQNIATVPLLLGWEKQRIEARVLELVDLVAIDRSMLDRYPNELSGGQRQRVGVARALAADPPVLLMDEPFGAVDPVVRLRLQRELLDLQQRLRKTIVFVTHDIDEAILVGDRVAILNTGGNLEQYATPSEILSAPASEFVSEFLGTDRGIKQLSLLPIDSVLLEPGPALTTSMSNDEAIATMDAHDVDWGVLIADGAVAGRVTRSDLAGTTIADATVTAFTATVRSDATLKEVLDVVVSSNGRFAAVCDEDHYLGMISTDSISNSISA